MSLLKTASGLAANMPAFASCRRDVLFQAAALFPGYITKSKGSGMGDLGPFWIEYGRRDTFRDLVMEIFVQRPYDFKCDTAAPVIIDVGANIGVSVLYFYMQYPYATLHAFEPSPSSYKLMLANIERNKEYVKGDFVPHQVALAKAAGQVDFYTEGDGCAQDSMYPDLSKGEKITVEADVLSKYLSKYPKVDFLKIDAEGGEVPILEELDYRGAFHRINQIVVEYHHRRGMRMGAFLDILERNGFNIHMSTSYKAPYVNDDYQGYVIVGYKK